jgi:NTP pyrophosphatase (non-canonical NTP hydrolase)
MNFVDYQIWTRTTAVYPQEGKLAYLTLGLSGEAGEIANKVKKVLRGDNINDIALRNILKSELGDVSWYIARLADEFDISLDEIMEYNKLKLEDRKKRGLLKGSGDER